MCATTSASWRGSCAWSVRSKRRTCVRVTVLHLYLVVSAQTGWHSRREAHSARGRWQGVRPCAVAGAVARLSLRGGSNPQRTLPWAGGEVRGRCPTVSVPSASNVTHERAAPVQWRYCSTVRRCLEFVVCERAGSPPEF